VIYNGLEVEKIEKEGREKACHWWFNEGEAVVSTFTLLSVNSLEELVEGSNHERQSWISLTLFDLEDFEKLTRTLVTGGAGFIGSNLVNRLLTLNHNVLVLDNLSFGKRGSIPQTSGKLSFVDGDISNPHVIPEIIKQLKEGKLEVKLGNIEPKRDFINVKDVAEAFIALLGDFRGDFGIFNIRSGKEYSIREIIEICARIIGKGIKIKSTKSRKRKTDRMHLLSDVEKIMKETSWRPRVDIEDGLRELLYG
jgi:nucleoside-diphosphate-sugar epimerase